MKKSLYLTSILCAVCFTTTALPIFAASDRYVDEEVASNYGYHGYPAAYKVKPYFEQVVTLARHFPQLKTASVGGLSLPRGAEGYFAIPQWQSIAPTYGEAVEKVFAVLAQKHGEKFYNWREGKLGPLYLREREHTAVLWRKLVAQEGNADILAVPAQFGMLHRNQSVLRARETFAQNEFDLGAFAVGIMLLTHPERLSSFEDLWIGASGDEYAYFADGQFSYAPFFSWSDGKVSFSTIMVDLAGASFGSASAFLPPQ